MHNRYIAKTPISDSINLQGMATMCAHHARKFPKSDHFLRPYTHGYEKNIASQYCHEN